MKKLLLAAAITAISTTAVANDYRFQVDAEYLNNELTKNADLNTYIFGGTFYLAPVDDSKGPKAEAAFLEKASDVHLAWGRTNLKIDRSESSPKFDDDSNVWALGGRYVTDSGIILALDYATTEIDNTDADIYGLSIGYYLSDTSSLAFGYTRSEIDDFDSKDDIWSANYKQLFNNKFGLEATLDYTDPKYGKKAYGITGALDYYINDDFSIGGVLGYISSSDNYTEAGVYGINAEYFFNSNIALNAGYIVNTPDKGDDDKVWSIGLTGRF